MKPTIKELKNELKTLGKEIFKNGITRLTTNTDSSYDSTTIVFITEYFVKQCQKGKIWNTPELLSTLQNCWYGVDNKHLKSPGGKDGIFIIDRGYRPENEMQKKIFNRFIDKENSLFPSVCKFFEKKANDFIAVRIVSHHLRLLGVMFIDRNKYDRELNIITLVDYDNSK